MRLLLVPLLLSCGPAVLSTFAVFRALSEYRSGRIRALPLWAVGSAWWITAYAAYNYDSALFRKGTRVSKTDRPRVTDWRLCPHQRSNLILGAGHSRDMELFTLAQVR
jgi:hypothetical protein